MKYNKKSFRNRLLDWYRRNQRRLPWRNSNDPYAIWISEVMLQQTTVKTVIPYYQRFLIQLPDVKHLAQSDLQTVLKLWEGLGYYARARNLHRAAQIVCEDYDGHIPSEWESFISLPGVGDYIAAAVLSMAFKQPFAVVDGNVKRVLARLDLIASPVNRSSSYKVFKSLASELLDPHHPGMFNQALMELGALICKPRQPKCDECPVQSHCRAYSAGQVDGYPKRIKKAPIPTHHVAVGVVFRNKKMLITRRKPEGLLGGLWEFPGGRVKDGETPEEACIREIKEEVGLTVTLPCFLARIRHTYTHFKIVMEVYCCQLPSGRVRLNGPTDFRWVELSDLIHYPFPKANHKIFPLLKQKPKKGPTDPHLS